MGCRNLESFGGGHAVEDARDSERVAVHDEANSRVGSRLNARRMAARAQDAVDLDEAMREAGASRASVARWLGVTDKVISRWCDPLGGSAPAAGDIDALPVAVRQAYRRIKADRESVAANIERRLLELHAALGATSAAALSGDAGGVERGLAALDRMTAALRGKK